MTLITSRTVPLPSWLSSTYHSDELLFLVIDGNIGTQSATLACRCSHWATVVMIVLAGESVASISVVPMPGRAAVDQHRLAAFEAAALEEMSQTIIRFPATPAASTMSSPSG